MIEQLEAHGGGAEADESENRGDYAEKCDHVGRLAQRAEGKKGRGSVDNFRPRQKAADNQTSYRKLPRMSHTPASAAQHLDALIIGAGFSGLYQLHCLRDKLGLSVQVVEAGGGGGGHLVLEPVSGRALRFGKLLLFVLVFR